MELWTAIRLGDERLDPQEDEDGQDERLDNLEQAAESRALTHRGIAGSLVGEYTGGARARLRPGPERACRVVGEAPSIESPGQWHTLTNRTCDALPNGVRDSLEDDPARWMRPRSN